MRVIKVVALMLIVAGVLGLTNGGFGFATPTHDAEVGRVSLPVKARQTVNIPAWVGVGAILLGGALLLGTRRS